MKNKLKSKKQWQARQIFDLDMKNTKGGATLFTYELTITGTCGYYPTSS